MAKNGQRKCLNCDDFFDSDSRNAGRQRYCNKPECRGASKAASQAAWLAKPQNSDYFSDHSHVVRVQAWRLAHPGYSRATRKDALQDTLQDTLQDALPVQGIDLIEEMSNRVAISQAPEMSKTPSLQDALPPLEPMMTGLIAHVFSCALQDDIDRTKACLIQLGIDVTNQSRHHKDDHASDLPPARTYCFQTILQG